MRLVEALNYRVGRVRDVSAVRDDGRSCLWSSITKICGSPSLWTLEMAQFTLVAYYMLGAPYSLQLGTNVRMDLLYAPLVGRARRRWWDAFTIFALMFYLGVHALWRGRKHRSIRFAIRRAQPDRLAARTVADQDRSCASASC